MKIIYIVGLLLICSTSVIADEVKTSKKQSASAVEAKAGSQPLNPNTIRIVTRPEIMGLWGMDIPNNKKCVEYYNFRSSEDVVIHSGEEWSYGQYDYQPSEDHNDRLPALIMQIKYDNNKKDCSGQQVDQAGDVSQYFVQWKNEHTINFCMTEKAEKCFATLRRILP